MTIKRTVYLSLLGQGIVWTRTIGQKHRETITVFHSDPYGDGKFSMREKYDLFFVNPDTLGYKLRSRENHPSWGGGWPQLNDSQTHNMEPELSHEGRIHFFSNLTRNDGSFKSVKNKWGIKVDYEWQSSKEARG